MLHGFALLVLAQLVGEAAARALGAPVPGPVIGLGLVAGALVLRGRAPPGLEAASGALLRHLSLLFVPAGAGVLAHLGLLAREGGRLALVLALSTLATLAVTALVFDRLRARGGDDAAEGVGPAGADAGSDGVAPRGDGR